MNSSPALSDQSFAYDLELALKLAERADAVSLPRFGALNLVVESKPDRSPVTDADKATEAAIRELLASERPEDSILGEELGTQGSSSRQWIIDPIDGTANFLRGNPIWGTLIALAIDGVPVVGVASAPALGRRWWAAKNLGSWHTNRLGLEPELPKQNQVSKVLKLEDSALVLPRLSGWLEAGLSQQAIELHQKAWRNFGTSDFWSYCLIAEGAADGTVEFGLQSYDVAALIPIVEEAGGTFTTLQGGKDLWGNNFIASNTLLHEQLLQSVKANQ